jgi:hypothetical protein
MYYDFEMFLCSLRKMCGFIFCTRKFMFLKKFYQHVNIVSSINNIHTLVDVIIVDLIQIDLIL